MFRNIISHKYNMLLNGWLPSTIAVCVIVLGVIVLLGWELDNKFLYGVIPGLPPMVPNTALGFILSGTSLVLLTGKNFNRLPDYAGQLLAVGILLIGIITIFEYLHIISMLSIDRLLVPIFSKEPFALRPSPHTAIEFSITGVALILHGTRNNQFTVLIQWLSLLLLMVGTVVFFGYIYGESAYYVYSDMIGMAVHTAAGFILLGLGILMEEPEAGLLRYVTEATSGGIVIRRLFPSVLLVPLTLGWFQIMGRKVGLFTEPFGVALIQILNMIIMAIIIAHVARIINRQESLKQHAEEIALQHQAELAHLDRLNTMSEMVTGIAHELNQPLTAMSTNAFACKRLLDTIENIPQEVRQSLDRICSDAKFAGEVTRRVQGFVRKEGPEKSTVMLDDLITEVVNLLDDEIHNHNVQLELFIDEQLPEIKADAIQIEQVILNIVRNSVEALESDDVNEKRLTISAYVNKAHDVQLDVCDTGPGMDSSTLSRIFESFFTTKGAGGMGMGLSISRSIIETHGGRIWAESTPSQGTCFSITLPLE